MSSYDSRNQAQIYLDELISKYKIRARDSKHLAEVHGMDHELAKQIDYVLTDLVELKSKLDKISKRGVNNAK